MGARLTHAGTPRVGIRAYRLGAAACRLGALNTDLSIVHTNLVVVRTDSAPVSLINLFGHRSLCTTSGSLSMDKEAALVTAVFNFLTALIWPAVFVWAVICFRKQSDARNAAADRAADGYRAAGAGSWPDSRQRRRGLSGHRFACGEDGGIP